MKAEIRDGKLTVTARRNEGKEFSAAMHGLAEAGCIESVNTIFESWGSTINVVFWPSFGCEANKKAEELKPDKECKGFMKCEITQETINAAQKEWEASIAYWKDRLRIPSKQGGCVDPSMLKGGNEGELKHFPGKGKITNPIHDDIIKQTNLERDEILKKAREEAEKIITDAEARAAKIIIDANEAAKKIALFHIQNAQDEANKIESESTKDIKEALMCFGFQYGKKPYRL